EGSVDAGRRVRPRGDGTHPRGQAWRSLDETGNRDWVVEGPPRRRELAAARARLATDTQERGGGIPRGTGGSGAQAVEGPLACNHQGAQTRAASCGVARRTIESGALRRTASTIAAVLSTW